MRLRSGSNSSRCSDSTVFRWKHGLFPAYDQDHMEALGADVYVTLVDNVDAIHERLTREHNIRHTLKDILVWREEEMVVTKCLARSIKGHGCSYVFARGTERNTVESLHRLPTTAMVLRDIPPRRRAARCREPHGSAGVCHVDSS